MNRRKFFKNGSLLAFGSTLLGSVGAGAKPIAIFSSNQKVAKNIIIVVSEGMSMRTLNMADLHLRQKSRNSQEEIAEKYLTQRFDVLMGGGRGYFDPAYRADKVDVLGSYRKAGYEV